MRQYRKKKNLSKNIFNKGRFMLYIVVLIFLMAHFWQRRYTYIAVFSRFNNFNLI